MDVRLSNLCFGCSIISRATEYFTETDEHNEGITRVASNVSEPFSQLVQKLLAFEACLQDNSLENGFASSASYPDKSLSFFEFISQRRFSTVENAAMEPAWAISGSSKQPSQPTAERIKKLLEQARASCGAPSSPIVAILGLLNAGKSSLVSTFLSETNRQRILIGSANAQGTHRFVLWLPESWRQTPVVWEFLQNRLRSVFGCDSEPLSEDPLEASRQYNDIAIRKFDLADGSTFSRAAIEIPLIATDPELDRWGIALMDCPDVQTGLLPANSSTDATNGLDESSQLFHEHSQWVAKSRFNLLATSAPLCSAFVVVLPANAMHDQTVSQLIRLLRDRMPNVQQILAVNRVPRKYDSREIQLELQKLYGSHSISRQYMAYGFDGPLLRERIPDPPSQFNPSPNRELPLFFRIDPPAQNQPPATIAQEDWLLYLGGQLNHVHLFADTQRSTLQNLSTEAKLALHQCEAYVRRTNQEHRELQKLVANACYEFSCDPGETGSQPKVRLQASRHVVLQISQSLEKTAPWWAMPGRWTTRLASSGKATLANATQWLEIPKWFSGKTEAVGQWIRARWKSGQSGKIVTADTLTRILQQHDVQGLLGLDDGPSENPESKQIVRDACQRAIDRFQTESVAELNSQDLDVLTAKMWNEMPWTRRLLTGLAPAGVLFAPLVAVVMVPLDFGGSAVLIFASLKELLLAGATGVGLVLASPDAMPKIAEAEAAWQQLGELYAILCGELGLSVPSPADMPRVAIGTTTRTIASVTTKETGLTRTEPLVPRAVDTYRLNANTVEKIEQFLNQLVPR
jgi:hypothetical protein